MAKKKKVQDVNDYIEKEKDEVREILEKRYPQIKSREDSDSDSLVHLVAGVIIYLKQNYQMSIDIDDIGFILSNITDATFYEFLHGSKVNDDYGIDGIVFIDIDDQITSGDDPKEIKEMIVYQSKSGKKHLKTADTVQDLLLHADMFKDNTFFTNNVIFKKVNAVLNERINATIYPLFICLNVNDNDTPEAICEFERQLKKLPDTINKDPNNIIFNRKAVAYIPEEEPPEEIKLQVASIEEYKYPSSPLKTYIIFAYIKDYLNFIKKDNHLKSGLFIKNVRGNAGQNRLNKDIKETFLNGPQGFVGDFWWLSNGVTIAATDMDREDSTLTLYHPSIINGQQTSRQLFEASQEPKFDDNNPSFSPWKIMIKLFVENKEESSQDAKKNSSSIDVLQEIISGLNSQTAINTNSIDLNNPYTNKVKRYLRNKDKGKIYYLEIRKGEFTKNPIFTGRGLGPQIISVELLIQYILSGNMIGVSQKEIGKIRSSKATVVRENQDKIFTKETTKDENIKTWQELVELIKMFEELFKPIKEGQVVYLKFAMFRILVNWYKISGEPIFSEKVLQNIKQNTTPKTIKTIKDKLEGMMEKYSEEKMDKREHNEEKKDEQKHSEVITNWDQYSKTSAFEGKLAKLYTQSWD